MTYHDIKPLPEPEPQEEKLADAIIAILQSAIQLMNDGGRHWIQGDYTKVINSNRELDEQPEHAFCSVGGMNQAKRQLVERRVALNTFRDGIMIRDTFQSASYAAKAVLAKAIKDTGFLPADPWNVMSEYVIVEFNDTPGRTFEEIRYVFEKAIEKVQKEVSSGN